MQKSIEIKFCSTTFKSGYIMTVDNNLFGRRASFEAGLTEVVLSKHFDTSPKTQMM